MVHPTRPGRSSIPPLGPATEIPRSCLFLCQLSRTLGMTLVAGPLLVALPLPATTTTSDEMVGARAEQSVALLSWAARRR